MFAVIDSIVFKVYFWFIFGAHIIQAIEIFEAQCIKIVYRLPGNYTDYMQVMQISYRLYTYYEQIIYRCYKN